MKRLTSTVALISIITAICFASCKKDDLPNAPVTGANGQSIPQPHPINGIQYDPAVWAAYVITQPSLTLVDSDYDGINDAYCVPAYIPGIGLVNTYTSDNTVVANINESVNKWHNAWITFSWSNTSCSCGVRRITSVAPY